LKEYDYSLEGAYFVTICTQNKENLFGVIVVAGSKPALMNSAQMILNDAGKMIFNIWNEIPKYYDGIDIDEFQIMPNHIHGIVIVGAAPCGRPEPDGEHETKLEDQAQNKRGQARGPAPTGLSLSNVMERFKSLTTKKYIDGIKLNNWKPFDKRLWQRNYYEHVIRNDNELNSIREYINNNPVNWETDDEFESKDNARG
jgi:REP element-mobilizing transposase RayT